jgi:hypothetical protein
MAEASIIALAVSLFLFAYVACLVDQPKAMFVTGANVTGLEFPRMRRHYYRLVHAHPCCKGRGASI